MFGSRILRSHQPLPTTLQQDARLVRTRLGHYYLCLPKPLDIRGESQAPPEVKHASIALDPGVRTFMTCYDVDGAVYDWGDGGMGRIYRLCHALDSLQSRWSVPTEERDMSFAVSLAGGEIEWASHSLFSLVANSSNALRPSVYLMLKDVIRFNREAPTLLSAAESNTDITLQEYLDQEGYSEGFRNYYLLPMVGAVWSASVKHSVFPQLR